MAGLFSLLQYHTPLTNVLWSFRAWLIKTRSKNIFFSLSSIALSQLLHLQISPKTSRGSSQIVKPPTSSVVKDRETPSPVLWNNPAGMCQPAVSRLRVPPLPLLCLP